MGKALAATVSRRRAAGAAGGRTASVVCTAQGPNPFRDLADLVDKYSGSGSSGRPLPVKRSPPLRPAAASGGMGNGVFLLLLLNFALFALQQFAPSLSFLAALPLSHWRPQWWQFITCTFVHANWEHLSGNAFSLLVFGRMVEEEEGAFGVWATYLLCGVGGALASYLSLPHSRTISLGASGAVFGLFAVAVFSKFKPSLKRLLEAVILGTFVARQVLQEVAVVGSGRGMALGGMSVGHWAHLGGAAVGVLLVLLLARLPDVPDS